MSEVKSETTIVLPVDQVDQTAVGATDDAKFQSKKNLALSIPVVRRFAIVIFMLAFGSLMFNQILGPLVHDRAATALEQRLASDLVNGVAPVSNPIALGVPIGLIDVPNREVRAVVIEGSKAEQLAQASGHLIGSALPGQPGVSAILGRSQTYGAEFKNLDQLIVGDEVVVTTGQGVHTYEVIDITVRSARDAAAFQGEGHMLILATVVNSSDRLVVRATLTSPVFPAGEATDHQTSLDELGLAGDSSSWSDLALWMLIAALLAAGFPVIVNQVGRRVGWLVVAPIAMWVALEVWTAISLMSPSAW
jgi:LPXTG-site transpeptidase (sortase) family protein